jgi:hypothetical protein
MHIARAWRATKHYILEDWTSNPWRLAGETYNAVTALATAVIFATMAPHVPYGVTYPLWLSGTAIMIFCGISRGSFGIVSMSIVMTIIDTVGYARYLLNLN